MNRIINRYLAGEIFKTSVATVLILFIILISNALGRVLADISDGDLPAQALWPIMLSQSVAVFSLLLPIGVFLGIIFAFGRLYKDHEMVVMNACGMGYSDFYKPVAMVVLPFFALSVFVSVWFSAQMHRSAEDIVNQKDNRHQFQQVKPGQFNQSKGGRLVFFMDSISDDRLQLNGIIISQLDEQTSVFETAEKGEQIFDQETGDLFMVIGPGKRHEGKAGTNSYNIIEFEQHGILIENNNKKSAKSYISKDLKTPAELIASSDPQDTIELHWRIAIPFVLLSLAFLALPLAYVAPRQGRYGKVGYALLVYIIYLNLMALGKVRLEDGSIPMALNFWWVHIIFFILSLVLLYKRNRGNLFGFTKEPKKPASKTNSEGMSA